jgi:hypothetical protein
MEIDNQMPSIYPVVNESTKYADSSPPVEIRDPSYYLIIYSKLSRRLQ